jgi:hypothetical protein
MTDLDSRIQAFDALGTFISRTLFDDNENTDHIDEKFKARLVNEIKNAGLYNQWFTEDNVRKALSAIAYMLQKPKLLEWKGKYKTGLSKSRSNCNVGVVMAGNIPLVGFHDMMSVLMAGHRFVGKKSSKDDKLPELIGDILIAIYPDFDNKIVFESGFLKNFDAIIATGSDNTSRYFEYYFGNYPHIIRKNRNSVAILEGDEPKEIIEKLADDIFLYFGLGCRNITKIFVPENYNFNVFFEGLEKFKHIIDHNKYANNYTYHKSIFLLNKVKHFDNGFLLLKEEEQIASPVGVLFYEHYKSKEALMNKLDYEKEKIQAIVCKNGDERFIMPGATQYPQPWDYADNVDTMDFLINL